MLKLCHEIRIRPLSRSKPDWRCSATWLAVLPDRGWILCRTISLSEGGQRNPDLPWEGFRLAREVEEPDLAPQSVS
jgi:hypothetical protein